MVIEGYWYTNIGSRSENEDSCAYFSPGPDQYCAVICDGLGGHGGGKAASSIGVKALSQWQADEALPSGETILAWMNEANRNILATRANANQMKTTAVALYLYKNQAVWAHIGDSRLYHFHNGVLFGKEILLVCRRLTPIMDSQNLNTDEWRQRYERHASERQCHNLRRRKHGACSDCHGQHK